MNEPLQRVREGDPFRPSALTWNAMVDAAEGRRGRQHDQIAPPPTATVAPALVMVQNDTGADLDRFAVVKLGAPIIAPADDLAAWQARPNVSGGVPASADDPIGILYEPVPAGAIGRAVVAGAVACQVDVTDAEHAYAVPVDGETGNLASAETGPARIIHRETGTGLKWALVLLGSGAAGDGGGGGHSSCCPTVASLCCPGGIPKRLYIEFTNKTGVCVDFPDAAVMDHDGGWFYQHYFVSDDCPGLQPQYPRGAVPAPPYTDPGWAGLSPIAFQTNLAAECLPNPNNSAWEVRVVPQIVWYWGTCADGVLDTDSYNPVAPFIDPANPHLWPTAKVCSPFEMTYTGVQFLPQNAPRTAPTGSMDIKITAVEPSIGISGTFGE